MSPGATGRTHLQHALAAGRHARAQRLLEAKHLGEVQVRALAPGLYHCARVACAEGRQRASIGLSQQQKHTYIFHVANNAYDTSKIA